MSATETEFRTVALTVLRRRVGVSPDVNDVKLATTRAYEDIAGVLKPLIGDTGFEALSSRALHLAQMKQATPSPLPAKTRLPAAFDAWLTQLDEPDAVEVASATFASLAFLLTAFVGETLTLRLLRQAWPDGFPSERPAMKPHQVMADLREANQNLVIANLRSQTLAEDVGDLYAEATELIEAKDQFFQLVSHELRTPMTSINGWAAVIGASKNPETVAEAIRSIASSAAVQTKLVNDLLDISRIMMRKFDVSLEDLDLGTVARDAASAAHPLAMMKRVSLHLNVVDSVMIKGDAVRLRQLLDNLLSNALKFTNEGGEILVTVSRDGRDAVLAVRDDGEGIAGDFLPLVFKQHAQASAGRFGGLGLGLAIVEHIVQMHGGSVVAESDGIGKGATFTVRLPATL